MHDVATSLPSVPCPPDPAGDDARLEIAIRLCRERNVLFTPLRRNVYGLLCRHGGALTAYQLAALYKVTHDKPMAAAPIYRALAFLQKQHFIARLESTNGYFAYARPAGVPPDVFFICQSCGAVDEATDPFTASRLDEGAARCGFRVKRRIVEVEGTCARCSADKPFTAHRR
ncbi:transcriptional repressor [Ancylobacter mangrovi]|uniref:transcriptional repressor n=1 Tax=Ancylobacter mangrovi TaxID=2972472 RepID=UPI002162170C|nr:transcriptional repressor [Ancylobacter mangrovi]MCS0504752.1 transcriptional repressor [Ancylobacter mangrovi]